MNYVTTSEELYTLNQARKLIEAENRRNARKNARIKARKRVEVIYYIKQKLSGAALTAISVLIPFINNGDITASVFLLPLGIYLLFTKEKVMQF